MSNIDILFSSSVINRTSQACIVDVTPPTFAGITSLVANPNGSLTASWNAGSDATLPIRYQIYVQANSSSGLFMNANFQGCARDNDLSHTFFTDATDNELQAGVTYYVGVRAVDAVGNINTNTVSLSAISTGVADNSLSNKLDAILAQTNKFTFDGSNYVNAHTKVNDDKTEYALTTVDKNLIADSVWNSLRSTHTISGSFGESNQGVVSTTRANNLDNLDSTISSRATQSSVNNIQNNTNFVGIVPNPLILPASGSKLYKIYAILNNTHGTPEDPDSNILNYRIEDSSGGIVVATTAMTRTGTGQYEASYTVNSTDTERQLIVFFEYAESSIAFKQVRVTEVQEFESKLDTLLTRLTSTRASNLDNLDVAVSTRESTVNAATRQSSILSAISAVQSDTDDIQSKIGTPAATLAADISVVNNKIGTPVTSVSADIAAVKVVADVINTKIGTPSVSLASDALSRFNTLNSNDSSILSAINSIQNNTSFVGVVPNPLEIPPSGSQVYKIYANLFDNVGAPNDPDSNIMNYRIEDTAGFVVVPTSPMTRDSVGQYSSQYTVLSTDLPRPLIVFFEYEENSTPFQQIRLTNVGSTQTNLDILVDRLTEMRAENLDNLDATISSRSLSTDVVTLLTRLTAPRAGNLDNLNATISSRATPADIDAGILKANFFEISGVVEDDEV